MKIYHYSVGRSGCTFLSQLLAGVFGIENLDAGHKPYKLEKDEPLVITLRDFRDVVLSFWRVQNDISFKDIESGRKASFKEILPQVEMVKRTIAEHLNPTFEDNNRILLLRYEEFFPDNFDFIFAEFESFFDVKIDNKKRKELKLNYSFKRNKYKASKMNSFKDYDKEFIHGLHLYQGKVGGWKELLDSKDHDALNSALSLENKLWRY